MSVREDVFGRQLLGGQNFFLGCAVFAFAGWKKILFESQLPKEKYLHRYSRVFHSVEGNSFFYGIPNLETLQKWRSQVPSDFLFAPKIPREYSHQGFIFPKVASVHNYVELLQRGLGENLGPCFLQLSPSYSKEYGQDLSLFLNYWRKNISIPICIEMRHPCWFSSPNQERINVMLSKMNMTRVILDTRPIYKGSGNAQKKCKNKKPNLPVSFTTTSQICVVRYISHPNMDENQEFLDEWVLIVSHWLEEGKQVYFFVHCPEEQYSPNIASLFYKKLKRRQPEVREFHFDQKEVERQLPLF
jgi:uncharacterized protein YecE (DUF72 family)